MKLEVRVDEKPVDDHLVKGHVLLTKKINKKPSLKFLSLTVCAKGTVAFTNQYGELLRRKKTLHTVSVPLLNVYEQTELESIEDYFGVRLPFEVQLPYNLPPSFIGDFGGIHYTCQAEVAVTGNLPHNRKTLSKKTAVVLVLNRNLNGIKDVQGQGKCIRRCESLWFDTSKVRLGLDLPNGESLKPGHPLLISVHISNLSSKRKSFTVSVMLYQKITWFHGSLYRYQTKVLDRSFWSVSIDSKCKSEDYKVQLIVPLNLPVEQKTEFYNIQYELDAYAAVFGIPGSCKLTVPLKILNTSP